MRYMFSVLCNKISRKGLIELSSEKKDLLVAVIGRGII